MMLHKFKKIKNKISIILATGLLGAMCSSPLVAFAQDSYFMAVTIDSHNYSIMSYVDFDDSSVGNAKEVELGNFDSLKDWKTFGLPQPKMILKI